jgi:hypothetical protein
MDSDGIPLKESSRYDGSNMLHFGNNATFNEAAERGDLLKAIREFIDGLAVHTMDADPYIQQAEKILAECKYTKSREKYSNDVLRLILEDLKDVTAPDQPQKGGLGVFSIDEIESRPIEPFPTKPLEINTTPCYDHVPVDASLDTNEKIHLIIQSDEFDGATTVLSVAAAPLSPIASGIIKGTGALLRLLYPKFQGDVAQPSITGGLMSNIIPLPTKPQIKSLTIWGVLIAALGALLGFFGLPTLTPEDQQIIQNAISPIMELVGLITAYIGRTRAKSAVEGIVNQKKAA